MAKGLNLNPQSLIKSATNNNNNPANKCGGGDKLGGRSAKQLTKQSWSVPYLPNNFSLDEAQQQAYTLAENYMNSILNREDMHITMVEEEGKVVGNIANHAGEQVNSYSGIDVLKLYAKNFKERGIIVDGRI